VFSIISQSKELLSMFLFLKVIFRKKIPPRLFHHKWSSGSDGDICGVHSRNADGALGNGAPCLPAGPPRKAQRAGAWGLWPPVPVSKEAVGQQCSHTLLRLPSNARGDDFSFPNPAKALSNARGGGRCCTSGRGLVDKVVMG